MYFCDVGNCCDTVQFLVFMMILICDVRSAHDTLKAMISMVSWMALKSAVAGVVLRFL
jgi:hypothetical protein